MEDEKQHIFTPAFNEEIILELRSDLTIGFDNRTVILHLIEAVSSLQAAMANFAASAIMADKDEKDGAQISLEAFKRDYSSSLRAMKKISADLKYIAAEDLDGTK